MMVSKVENRGLIEEKLKLFNEDTRFVSSYKEAIIREKKEGWFELSMLLNGTERIYVTDTFSEAYRQYEVLLKNDKKGVFI